MKIQDYDKGRNYVTLSNAHFFLIGVSIVLLIYTPISFIAIIIVLRKSILNSSKLETGVKAPNQTNLINVASMRKGIYLVLGVQVLITYIILIRNILFVLDYKSEDGLNVLKELHSDIIFSSIVLLVIITVCTLFSLLLIKLA